MEIISSERSTGHSVTTPNGEILVTTGQRQTVSFVEGQSLDAGNGMAADELMTEMEDK